MPRMKQNISTKHNFELNRLWIRFVNRKDWKPTKHSVLCELHFEEKYIVRGGKSNLKWSMNPIPTKHSKELLKMPSSLLPTSKTTRKPPRERLISNDQMDTFCERDTITSLVGLYETTAPDGFQFKKSNDHALFYNLVFDEETKFPKILESIKVDSDLHVQLQYNGIPVPLPQRFVKGHNAQLKKVSMLKNLPAHIRNVVFDNCNELLDELNKRKFLKPKGRPPYSVGMICYGLHLRHISFQAYKQLLEKFPLPSISLLNKILQGGVNSIKALKILQENGKISNDCILMVDEMYLEKATQYHNGKYVGADDERNLYKGIVTFMIMGLKESIPYIAQTIPEVKFISEWLADKMSNCIDDLTSAEFFVRGIVTDNHASTFNSNSYQYIKHRGNFDKKTYLFYDMVLKLLLLLPEVIFLLDQINLDF